MDSTNTPHDQYLRYTSALPHSCPIPAYVNWLEQQYQVLSHPHIHPTAEEAGEMDGEAAAHLVEQRIYDAACVVERFEVGGSGGKYIGNGHHFAQHISQEAKEYFNRCWLQKKEDHENENS